MLRLRSSICLLVVAASAARALVADWAPPLSTRGRYVVDANGDRFKLKSGNWHGSSGTWNGEGDFHDDAMSHAGENSNGMALGLQYVPIDKILDSFEELGINSIRLPFANEMIHDENIIRDEWVAANPQFRGKTMLAVYDEVVKALTERRFAVILNNHTNRLRWCCSTDGNERWNASQDEESWIADWVFMVNRYKDNKRVAGADLYNEVRRNILDDPNWGWGNQHDWWMASQHAGDRILTDANSDVLIIIEGINWQGIPIDHFPHGRPTLTPARELSHTLMRSDKLVYSAHFYSYTGPHHTGATGMGETTDARYRDFSPEELLQVYYDQAAFVAQDKDAHYTRPVWISEFGIGRLGAPESDQKWFQNTVDWLVKEDLDFAYWPLVGYLENGQGNGWALQNWNKAGQRDGLNDADDWRKAAWYRLANATTDKTGPVEPAAVWQQLSMDHEDYVKSMALRGNDFDNGARKAACPDGTRLIGVSNGQPARGLCTNAGAPGATNWARFEVVWEEKYVTQDWAGGHTKYQCPDGAFMVGLAVRGAKVSTVVCGFSDQPLGMAETRTVWFDRGEDRGDAPLGGEYASGQYKGQCGVDEHIAGIAFTTGWGKPGVPAAIFCRK